MGFRDKVRKVKFFNIFSMGNEKSQENSVDPCPPPPIDIDETRRIDMYRDKAIFDKGCMCHDLVKPLEGAKVSFFKFCDISSGKKVIWLNI